MDPERLEILETILNCQIGTMPFTYLGLPLGTTRSGVADCLPIVQRIERRLVACSQFFTQAGKLEMVNTMLSFLPTFFMCMLKIPATIIKEIDKYKRYGLWRGSDINANKVPLAAWKLITRPKIEGGMGVIRVRVHNEAMLMKQLQKFLNKEDLPWVQILWDNYYCHGQIPG